MQGIMSNQKGFSFIKLSIYLLILMVFYTAYLYIPVLIRYYDIKEAVSGAANMALTDKRDDFIRNEFSEKLKKKIGVAIPPTALSIIREPSRSRVSEKMMYQERVRYIPFNYVHTIDFTVEHTAMGHYLAY